MKHSGDKNYSDVVQVTIEVQNLISEQSSSTSFYLFPFLASSPFAGPLALFLAVRGRWSSASYSILLKPCDVIIGSSVCVSDAYLLWSCWTTPLTTMGRLRVVNLLFSISNWKKIRE